MTFKLKRLEFLWFTGTVMFSALLYYVFIEKNILRTHSIYDFKIHDTYITFTNYQAFIFLFIFTTFILYAVRLIVLHHNSLFAIITLMIASICFILILSETRFVLMSFDNLSSSWTVKPPLSKNLENATFNGHETNEIEILRYLIAGIQFLLMIILTYSGYRIGIKYKN